MDLILSTFMIEDSIGSSLGVLDCTKDMQGFCFLWWLVVVIALTKNDGNQQGW